MSRFDQLACLLLFLFLLRHALSARKELAELSALLADERELLNQGHGKVLLFQLNGAMIFGVAKAINREHNAISDCRAVVFDLSVNKYSPICSQVN